MKVWCSKRQKENVSMGFVDYKTCKVCGELKPADLFHKHSSGKFGVRGDCAACVTKYTKEYRTKNRDSIRAKKRQAHKNNPDLKRKHYLKSEYGMTIEEYEIKLASQGGACAVCKSTSPKCIQHKHLYIDHCHATGKIRDILCGRCNAAIGQAEENPERLEDLAAYIRKHKEST